MDTNMVFSVNSIIRIPCQTTFPSVDVLYSYDGFPDSVGDGLVVDLFVPGINKLTVLKKNLKDILGKVNKNIKLSSPVYIGRDKGYEFFVCIASNGDIVSMQTKYYQYFFSKYYGCKFFCNSSSEPIYVVRDEEVCGIFMPLILSETMLESIKSDIIMRGEHKEVVCQSKI